MDLHPDELAAAREARAKPAPKPDPEMTALKADLELVRMKCPALLAFLDRSTEPVLGTVEQMAFQTGRRDVFRMLRGQPDGR